MLAKQLWFDVKLKRYSTSIRGTGISDQLWFDVKLKRYSTASIQLMN